MKQTVAVSPEVRLRVRDVLLAVLASLILAAWVSRIFAVIPSGHIYENDNNAFNVYMFTDFREAIGTGHWFPQWSTYIHHGLGDAIFSYYEPGFFYLASIVPHRIEAARAMGIAVFLTLALGSFSMWHLIGSRFGPESGIVAMTLFVLSNYAGTEVYLRGDYQELMAMMLLPLLLDSLLAWRRSHQGGWFVASAVVAGALIVAHPIALAAYFCLVVCVIVEDIVVRHNVVAAVINGLPLPTGALLAAFYWFPVMFEMKLVQASAIFSGFDLYSRHFVGLRALLGHFSDSPNVVPVALGPVLIASASLATVWLLVRKGSINHDQAVLLRMLMGITALAGFLILRFSSWVWILFPELQRLQFPWRILTLLTMGLAGIAATLFTGRYRNVAACIVISLAFLAYPYHVPVKFLTVPLARPADLIKLDYAQNELSVWPWLPKGAQPSPPAPFPEAYTTGGGCALTNFQIGQSLLKASVDTTQGCVIHLPHYYFPGWHGSLNGFSIPVEEDDGWMTVRFPNGGRGTLMLVYGASPARRIGLWVSATTSLFLVFCAAMACWRTVQPEKVTDMVGI
jgi:hypothetical protein